MKRKCALLALAILTMSVAAQAATITTYSTQSAFSNAATGITMLDFSSFAVSAVLYNNAAGLTVGGINIFGKDGVSNYSLTVADSSFDPHYVWGTKVIRGGNSTASDSYIQLNFAGVTAIAFHLATFWPGSPVKLTLSSGESFTVNTATVAPATFWGFTSDTAENYVRISTIGGNGSPVVVDFQYGAAGQSGGGDDPPADTPEVMTLLTLGAGLVALRCLKRFQAANRPATA